MSEPKSLVERLIAQAFDDLLVNDDGAVPWSHIANARNEVLRVAAAELSTLRSRCETLEAALAPFAEAGAKVIELDKARAKVGVGPVPDALVEAEFLRAARAIQPAGKEKGDG